MSKYLQRDEAPFGEAFWERIDAVVVGAARSRLCARRFLSVLGPFGLEMKTLPGRDEPVFKADNVSVSGSRTLPVALLSTGFMLPGRDIAAFEAGGPDLDLTAAAEAALSLADQEDHLILYGSEDLGVAGLTSSKGVRTVSLDDWAVVNAAAENVIRAVDVLDSAGFHGPYALALAPDRYNLLLRRYPHGDATELEHIRQIATEGIVKAPALQAGGVLVATGAQYAAIMLGQDLQAGFVGPAPSLGFEFSVSESLALRLSAPEAVCVIR